MGSSWVPHEWQALRDEIDQLGKVVGWWTDSIDRRGGARHTPLAMLKDMSRIHLRLVMYEEIVRERLQEGE